MRRTTASVLAVAGLAALATGQPPAPKAPADPTDALIQKALANDPDVQVARAKLALAEAEVAKARQAAVARAITLRDAVEQHRQTVARLAESFALKDRLAKTGQLAREELLAAQDQLAAARATLNRAETDLRLLTGDGPRVAADAPGEWAFLHKMLLADRAAADDAAREKVIRAFNGAFDRVRAAESSGPIPDRIRAALDVKVRLGGKGDGIALDAAMEVFKKQAGFDVSIRPTPSPMPRIVLDGEELPVGAWLQMFQDHGGHAGITFYVREYGLLVANRQTAPPDALTLTEFWRTRPVVAAPKAPDPK